ncbi:lysis protein [Pseudescherichia sp.]|uniref:lysis protein n=1 Tax=Pseudescherichia sp. TaxID=2055881 RepID=UPI003916CCFF
MLFGLMLVALVVLGRIANFYHTNAITYKDQRDKAASALQLAKETITDMQTRQRDVAALDAKYTGELADAQETIDQLERDVDAGRKRLRLNAECPASGTASTGSLGDASGPELTGSAKRDYFTLRERIATVTKQVGYLQDYIKTQCP